MHWFPEPHLTPETNSLFTSVLATSEPYVVKFMPEHISNNPWYQLLVASDCYKIKLTRESKLDQIASQYIALMTDVWNSKDPLARGEHYSVDIFEDTITTAIETIIRNDKLFDTLDIQFDKELTYEELLNSGQLGSRHTKILPPTNIVLLKRVIEKAYDKYR
jgi:hypothetical protein